MQACLISLIREAFQIEMRYGQWKYSWEPRLIRFIVIVVSIQKR